MSCGEIVETIWLNHFEFREIEVKHLWTDLHSLSRLSNGFLSILIIYNKFVFPFHLLLIFCLLQCFAVMLSYYLHAIIRVPFLMTVTAAIETTKLTLLAFHENESKFYLRQENEKFNFKLTWIVDKSVRKRKYFSLIPNHYTSIFEWIIPASSTV